MILEFNGYRNKKNKQITKANIQIKWFSSEDKLENRRSQNQEGHKICIYTNVCMCVYNAVVTACLGKVCFKIETRHKIDSMV